MSRSWLWRLGGREQERLAWAGDVFGQLLPTGRLIRGQSSAGLLIHSAGRRPAPAPPVSFASTRLLASRREPRRFKACFLRPIITADRCRRIVACVSNQLSTQGPQEPVRVHAILQKPVQVSMTEGNGLFPCLCEFGSRMA